MGTKSQYISVATNSEGFHGCRVVSGNIPVAPFPMYEKMWVTGQSCELLQFPLSATGNVAPTINIQGTNNFEGPEGNNFSLTDEADVDNAGNQYVLGSFLKPGGIIYWFVMVFPPGVTGNVLPARTITGTNTGFNNYLASGIWGGLCVDSNQNIYVGLGNTIRKFVAGATGNASPSIFVQSSMFGADNTSNQAIMSLTYDVVRNWIWVTFGGGQNGGPALPPGVAAYDISGNLQVVLRYSGIGPTFQSLPWQTAIGPDGSVYISDLFADNGLGSVIIFEPNNFATPSRTLTDSTGLWSVGAFGIAVDANGIIYVATGVATGSINNTIYSYPANSNGDVHGTNLTAINGNLTELTSLINPGDDTQPLKLRLSVK